MGQPPSLLRALTPSWWPTPTVPWPPSTLTTLRPPPSIRRPSPRLAELTSPSVFTPLGLWCLMCMLPTLAAATAAHLATKGYGVYGYPYHYGVYGKREADAQLVHHANGAVTPYDPNLAIATNAHLATRFGYGYYGHPVVYGKREAQIPVGLVTGYSAVHAGYPFHYGYGVAPVVSPFVAHPNGALVPAEPKDVVDARAEHLAAHAVEKRE